MSTAEQRKRLKQHSQESERAYKVWADNGYQGRPETPEMPEDLKDLQCGAKTKGTGQPCKLKSIYSNGRCKFHGGLSTGAKTAEGKAKVALNGLKPKRKKLTSCEGIDKGKV